MTTIDGIAAPTKTETSKILSFLHDREQQEIMDEKSLEQVVSGGGSDKEIADWLSEARVHRENVRAIRKTVRWLRGTMKKGSSRKLF